MKNKKILLIASVATALIGTAAFAYMSNRNTTEQNPTQNEISTPKTINEVDYSPGKSEDKIQPSSKDEVINGDSTQEGAPVAPASDISVSITQAAQREGTVFIRALVNGTGSGTCTLTLTRGGSTVTRDAPVGVQASYSICQGFNVPVSEFSESGEWQVTVQVATADNKRASANTKVNITR